MRHRSQGFSKGTNRPEAMVTAAGSSFIRRPLCVICCARHQVWQLRMQALPKTAMAETPRAQRRPMAQPLTHYLQAHADRQEGMRAAYA